MKRHNIPLSLAEMYAIRNALRKTGGEPQLLEKIEKLIEAMHDYFDGRIRRPDIRSVMNASGRTE